MYVSVYRRKGKSSATVDSTNLVVLETVSSNPLNSGEDQQTEMGNKSSSSSGGFSPNEKENGGCFLVSRYRYELLAKSTEDRVYYIHSCCKP